MASPNRAPSRRLKIAVAFRYSAYASGFEVATGTRRSFSPPCRTTRSSSATARAIRSCSSKTSVSSPSKLFDQRWKPSAAFTSWAVMRTLFPWRRTEPSRTFATPSALPMVRRSSFLPLNWKDEVRPATRRPFTRASASRISSAMPSEKYSWSLAGLRSAKASTATDGGPSALAGPAAAVVAGARCPRQKNQATPGAPSRSPAATRSTSARVRGRGSAVSTRPARTSKIQASTRVIGNPSPSATTVAPRTQSGSPSPCMMGSATWSTAKATRP
ncbi:MAG: hypothetical protein QM704_00890 [Anaeromyxobacteraceae bacterium]